MKLTLFGDNNRKSSNERLQKNVLDELKANGLHLLSQSFLRRLRKRSNFEKQSYERRC